MKLVKGFMTFGSPINKHIVLWPGLWPHLPTDPKLVRKDVGEGHIKWRNYYDYGDPVGFELTEARKWLAESKFEEYFEFQGGVCHDIGFARYVLPGWAHTGYWEDDAVFRHFIRTVIDPKEKDGTPAVDREYGVPKSRWTALVFGPCLPYLLAAALCIAGMYLIYKGVCEIIMVGKSAPPVLRVVFDVLGLSAMLAAFIVIARIPRLTILRRYHVMSLGMLPLAGVVNWLTMSNPTLELLSVRPPDPAWSLEAVATGEMLMAVGVIGVLAQIVGNWRPTWMTTRNAVLAGFVVCVPFVALAIWQSKVYPRPEREPQPAWWPLVLGAAAAFYLWRLAAMVFDLAFVWHRHIRRSVMDKYLGRMLPKPANYYKRKNQLVKEMLGAPAPSPAPDAWAWAGAVPVALSVPASVSGDRIQEEIEKEARRDADAIRRAGR